MSLTRLYTRSPRILPELPGGEVDLVSPKQAPQKPTSSLVTAILPLAGTLIGVIVMWQAGMGTAILMIPMMAASYAVAMYNYFNSRKKYKEETGGRNERYYSFLNSIGKDLERLERQQQNARQQNDPKPEECLTRVVNLDARLWERSPSDSDFLSLRVGTGSEPLLTEIKLPREDPTQESDPLIEAAHKVGKKFGTVENVPITLPLAEAGVGGIAGPRERVLSLTRATVIQLCTHHSPDEVNLYGVFPSSEGSHWEWLRWLPHVWTEDRYQRFLASYKDSAHRLMIGLDKILQTRKRAVESTHETKKIPLPRLVIILADPSLVEGEPVLPMLLQDGPSLGAYPIFLADRPEDLPKGCRVIAQVGPIASRLIRTESSGHREFEPDYVPPGDDKHPGLAEQFARSMASIRLQRISTSADIPDVVTLMDVLNVSRIEDLDILSRWRKSLPDQSLAVPIGRKAGGEEFILDIHEKAHGPHGLGAGTTGSGKSELLQSMIAAMAVDYHPHELNFVLVDYKGGGMSNAFEGLPHLVGTITNLEGNLSIRALRALKAEMERRQKLLGSAGENNINDYLKKFRKGEVKEPMPHLVILVDEFAELSSQMPDFMRELVSVARLGRSLGVHLILTTQKPAGVVSEQIWANSRFKFCLKVEKPEDSRDVIRRPDAANLTRPGQTYIQVGNDEIFEQFQSAYSGARYEPGGIRIRDPHEVLEVALDGSRQSLKLSPKPTKIDVVTSQLEAVVSHLHQIAEKEGVERLSGPWLPELPEIISLEACRPKTGWDGKKWKQVKTWIQPVIGLVDDPDSQRQDPLRINLGREGHMVIYGAPGTGKTTLLQTLITSLALDHSPEELNLYLVDFGARILTLFKDLPQVGGVVLADDDERLQRLLKFLVRQIEIRKEKFSQAGVSNLISYRSTKKENLPAIIVVIDNFPGFINAYPDENMTIAQISSEGGNLGIHLVLTANSPTQIRIQVSNNITMALALQLTDRADYTQAVGRTSGLEPEPVSGRGLIREKPPLEFQTALPVPGDREADRTKALQSLIGKMQKWKGEDAPAIPEKPDVVALAALISSGTSYPKLDKAATFCVPLGLDLDDLDHLKVDLSDGPNFLISGTVQSGKTTLLQSWLLALAERFPPKRVYLYLVDYQQEGLFPLQSLPHVKRYITNEEDLGEVLGEISTEIGNRRDSYKVVMKKVGDSMMARKKMLSDFPAIILAMDDFILFDSQTNLALKERMEEIIRRSRGYGLNTLATASIGDVSTGFTGIMKALKEVPTGFLLGSTDASHLNNFNVTLPADERGKVLPPGEGIYAQRGKYKKVKCATAWEGALTMQDWVKKISKRKRSKK